MTPTGPPTATATADPPIEVAIPAKLADAALHLEFFSIMLGFCLKSPNPLPVYFRDIDEFANDFQPFENCE